MKVFLIILATLMFACVNGFAQVNHFSYQSDKVPVGKVFIYQKSNQDGSNLHWVATYIASPTHIESLKWTEGHEGATLVTADIDWQTFSVKKFVAGRLQATGEKMMGGQLDMLNKSGAYRVQFGDMVDSMQIDAFPWHSYDFDFASLNLIWAQLRDVRSDFSIQIADVVEKNGRPVFANKGPVSIQYQQEEKHNGVDCYVYLIDGPGLENRGGTIWVSKAAHHFVEYLIDLPDEDAFRDMKFTLDQIEEMDAEEWETFQLKKAKGSP